METNETFIINSRPYANTIKFLIGVDFKEVPHKTMQGKNVFLFEDTPLLRETIDSIMKLRKQLNK